MTAPTLTDDRVQQPYWTHRLAEPSDLPEILRLIRAVHGDTHPELDEAYLRWRYFNDTPFRAQIMLAEHEGRPIGIQPLAIFAWDWGDARLRGAMYTGVLTHPDHRRKGVFQSLLAACNDYAAQVGAQFCMMLPNEASFPGFIKTNWTYPGLIPLHLRISSPGRALATRIGGVPSWLASAGPSIFFRPRAGPTTGIHCEPVSRVLDELDDVATRSSARNDGVRLRRSAAYWNWRYDSTVGRGYHTIIARRAGRLVGAAAVKVGQRAGLDVGMILDLVSDDDAAAAIVDGAQQRLLELGAGIVTCQASSPHLSRMLRDRGFRPIGPRFSGKRFHFVFRPTGVSGLPRMPAAMADWSLMFGDSDNV